MSGKLVNDLPQDIKLEKLADETGRGIRIADLTALLHYGYSDRTPLEWDIAVDKDTSKSRFKLDYPYIKSHTI